MNKFKNWLKVKLKEFLDIGNLESNFKDHETFNNIRFSDIEKDMVHLHNSVGVLHNTIENVVHIGTDVKETSKYNNERSWAVICVEGKLNLVKFVSLDVRSIRELLQYLKQYEAGRHCIDSPHSELFYEGLFKF
jgi:hypothetical protein